MKKNEDYELIEEIKNEIKKVDLSEKEKFDLLELAGDGNCTFGCIGRLCVVSSKNGEKFHSISRKVSNFRFVA